MAPIDLSFTGVLFIEDTNTCQAANCETCSSDPAAASGQQTQARADKPAGIAAQSHAVGKEGNTIRRRPMP